jgi:glutaminyl-tRNA synthetase
VKNIRRFPDRRLKDSKPELRCQFERLGYFTLDKHSSPASNDWRLIFNRTITLKDTRAKEAQKSSH